MFPPRIRTASDTWQQKSELSTEHIDNTRCVRTSAAVELLTEWSECSGFAVLPDQNRDSWSCYYYTQKLKKTKVTNNLMPRTLFWFQCILSTWQRMVPIRPVPYTFNICPTVATKACILPWKKLVWGVRSQEVTTCFTSASVANCLPGRCFLQYSNSMTSHCQLDLCRLWCYGWEIMDHPPYSPDHAPSWQEVCDSTDIKQVVTFWPHPLDTDFFYAGTQAWCHGGIKASMWLHGSLICAICYHVPYTLRGE